MDMDPITMFGHTLVCGRITMLETKAQLSEKSLNQAVEMFNN